MRSARLWLNDRQQQLAERTEELDAREQTILEAEKRLVTLGDENRTGITAGGADKGMSERIQAAMDVLRKQRKEHQEHLDKQKQQIDKRREASLALVRQLLKGVERRRTAVEDEYQQSQRDLRLKQQTALQKDYQKAAKEFEQRQQYLDGAEALLINGQADLEVQQKQLKMQKIRCETEARKVRLQVAQQQRQHEAEWQERQAALNRRSQQLESRQAAIEQTRGELSATHRQALELRLATEELWAKLSDVMPAPALTAELGRIRRDLAESYSLERTATVRENQQLAVTHERLAEQYVKLNAEKKELHDWITRRQQEIEYQAARLVAREQELDRQEAENEQRSERWDGERRHLQDEMRRLMAELRRFKSGKADAFETASTN